MKSSWCCKTKKKRVFALTSYAEANGGNIKQLSSMQRGGQEFRKERLKPIRTPSSLWEEVASDVMERKSEHCLVAVDDVSKFIEANKIKISYEKCINS